MNTLICGSRDIGDARVLEQALEQASSRIDITGVISGGARGVDTLVEAWAMRRDLPLTVMRAEWERWGKSAGYRRNAQMIEIAEACVAVWDGSSRGTRHSIELAVNKRIPLFVAMPKQKAELYMSMQESGIPQRMYLFHPLLTYPWVDDIVEKWYNAMLQAEKRHRLEPYTMKGVQAV